MAAASYTTDLQTFNDCSSVTGFNEPSGFTATDSGGEVDTDLSIYGSQCITESQRKSGSGGLFYTGSQPAGWTDGDCFFGWYKFFAPNATGTKTSGSGIEMFVGSSSSNFNRYYVAGSDTYAYGGWINYVVNPNTATVTASNTTGSPSGTHNGMGFGCTISYGISKGNSHNMDIFRWGRGEVIITDGDLANGYANFDDLATVNDNATTGRWGLFQKQGASYLWKGLMTLGNATAVDFRDSNVTIAIDNTEFVQAAFNYIEVNNTSSNVEWNSVTISALGTVSRGSFEVVDNATVTLNGCTFNDMDFFIFNGGTNANTITDCTFRGHNYVVQGGGIFSGCNFIRATSGNSLFIDDATNVTDCVFTGDGTTTPGHAVDLGTIAGGNTPETAVTIVWSNELDNGVNQSTWEGSTQASTAGTQGTANDAITLSVDSDTYAKISVAAGATIPTVQNTGTGFLEISANEVTLTITVVDIVTNSPIEGAMVYCTNSGETVTYINKVETNASGQVSFTGSLASAQVLAGNVRAATPDEKAYTKFYKSSPIVGTFSNLNDTNITISMIPDE